MKKIKIEKVSDIHCDYPYLELFFKDNPNPFLEIAVSESRNLTFKVYASTSDVLLTVEEMEYVLSVAKDFLPTVLKDEDDFLDQLPL